MINPLDKMYGHEVVEMPFSVPREVALNRLKSRVKRFDFTLFKSNGMVGSVKPDAVAIYRSSVLNNAFRPIFVGTFENATDGTKLYGEFRLHRMTQIWMIIWSAGVLSLPVLMTVISIRDTGEILVSILAGLFFSLASLLMIGLLIGVLKLGKRFSEDDKDWLKKEISNAINSQLKPSDY